VVSKLFTAVFVVQFIITPLWPALAEAMARGDLGAAARMYYRFFKLCALLGVAIAFCFVLVGRPLIALWVGDEFVPQASLLLGFGAWIVVASLHSPVAALLSTDSLVKYLLLVYGIAAISSFILKVVLGHLVGIPGIIWGTVIGYGALLFYAQRVAREVLKPA
jgi:O-antigen/teichoic acid export membrane protein